MSRPRRRVYYLLITAVLFAGGTVALPVLSAQQALQAAGKSGPLVRATAFTATALAAAITDDTLRASAQAYFRRHIFFYKNAESPELR